MRPQDPRLTDRRSILTPEMKEYIRANSAAKSCREMTDELGLKSIHYVMNFCNYHNLPFLGTKGPVKKDFNDELFHVEELECWLTGSAETSETE